MTTQQSGREAFEAWAVANCPGNLHRDADGEYSHANTHAAWLAWQAALSARAQGEDKRDAAFARFAEIARDGTPNDFALEIGEVRKWFRKQLHGFTTPAAPKQHAVEVTEALKVAEAALADIGDADREPGDDIAWAERRAAVALPQVRAALLAALTGKTEVDRG